ncbi:MAG: pyrroline-5-carboxylate reductase [Caldiserica bacterium]|nr:pyrroline-5-carboxylate reductase [Caldisericota bacterium]
MNFGIIGCGNMGEVILKGVLEEKLTLPWQVWASDVRRERLNYIKNTYGVNVTNNNEEVVEKSSLILLSIKPQEMHSVLAEVKSAWQEDKVAVSIAAGVKIARILQQLGEAKVIRVMPNLCIKVKQGMSAIAFSNKVRKEEKEAVRRIFSSVGEVVEVEETAMDAVTAISGSGPAYVFYFLEALVEAGEHLGFSHSLAYLLAFKTLQGAVELLKEGDDPADLRRRVTSKGGTTERALNYLKEKEFKAIIRSAVEKAYLRSRELSES